MGKPIAKSDSEPHPILSRAEWDFSSIPQNELMACVMWEYLRESKWDTPSSRRLHAFVLQWTYDTWEHRKKLNARYQNIPKSIIAAAATERGETTKAWQDLSPAKRRSFTSPTPSRPALIPVKIIRQSLWDWTYTFNPEAEALHFGDWFKGIDDLLATFDKKFRDQLDEVSQTFIRKVSRSNLPLGLPSESEQKSEHQESVTASEVIAALQPEQHGIPMELASGRLFNFLQQPDFLINWHEYDKPAIKKAFAEWLDNAEPKTLKPRVLNSEARSSALRRDLLSLGILRLLHSHTLPELMILYPAEFGRYRNSESPKELYRLRTRAIDKFRTYVAVKDDELPASVGTKSGRSPLGG